MNQESASLKMERNVKKEPLRIRNGWRADISEILDECHRSIVKDSMSAPPPLLERLPPSKRIY